MIDLTINLGNLLTIASFLIGGIAFVMNIRSMLAVLHLRLERVEETSKDVQQEMRKYEERFLRVEGMIDDLRHNRGFIRHD